MDCTYSTVPPNIFKFKLMAISGHNYNDNTTVLMNEKKYTFDEVFKILKIKYKFNSTNMMCDLRISPIKSIQNIFPRCSIHCCFFYYSQALWKHFMKYGLGGINACFLIILVRLGLEQQFPKKLWNFSDVLENGKNFENFYFTNNFSENINRYLNRNLKRAKCSSILFRRNVLDIILQFNNKNKYDSGMANIINLKY